MRIVLVAIVFPPLRISGAIQLRDLAAEFARQGHDLTVLVPTPDLDADWRIEDLGGARIVRLRAPTGRDRSHMRRTLEELLSPFFMMRNLRKSPLARESWDAVVWYAPSIFYGPIVHWLKRRSRCHAYLIIRDIFPEWAVNLGLMRRGLPYLFFKAVEAYQYSVADVVGVQSPANRAYFDRWATRTGKQVEVLHNWLTDDPDVGCSITVANTALAGRKILIYAGNMGLPQGMDVALGLAAELQGRPDVGLLFVGRGSEVPRLQHDAIARGLDNVLFFDEVEPHEIPGLYKQCHVGLVCLDPRHTTHSIPGKFVSYMRNGLPVLASINPGNDLMDLIEHAGVGRVSIDGSAATLRAPAESLLEDLERGDDLSTRCRALAGRLFSPEAAVKQIVEAIEP
jgi:glycosyltransferase involved in cell wall biosynthesis